MPLETERTQVTLELEPEAEPIRGRLRDAQGESRPFTGWLELLSLLDRLRGEPPLGTVGPKLGPT